MIRAFLALPLPDDLADLLVPVQAALLLPRPVPAQDFHITLTFLGEAREDLLSELDLALQSARLPAPMLALDGLGTFGGARVENVHAVIRPDPALDRLQARVTQMARSLGIAVEKRRFQPHVTLGRGAIPDAAALARAMGRVGAVTSPAVPALRLTMFRSRLRPEGPLYDPLADYPLTSLGA
jgi:RNA 2',3'-cyclic 3'-phosphodiesterase